MQYPERIRKGKKNPSVFPALAGAVLLLALLWAGPALGEAIQDCHRVTNTCTDTKQSNKSVVRIWHAETALEAVTEEINGIAEAWAEELGPQLPAAR